MSITDMVAIGAGVVLTFAVILTLLHGGPRKHLGPMGQETQASRDSWKLNLRLPVDPWLWIKLGAALAAFIAAIIAITVYFAAIKAMITGASLPTLSWKTILTLALVFLALAYTFRDFVFRKMAARAFKGAAIVLLWIAIGIPVLTAILPCSSTDIECKYQQSTKEEQQRQKQAAAQRAVEATRQPSAPQCNIQRKPHRYPATKPAALDNPGGVCALALFIEGHCVYFTQNNNDQPHGIICVNNNQVAVRDMRNNAIDMPEDVDRVWSTGEAFDGSIGFWQPRYTQLFSWR